MILSTRLLFKEIEKQVEPVRFDEKVQKPSLDFPDQSYQYIHNTYADSIRTIQAKRQTVKKKREYTEIELAAQELAKARQR